MQIQDGSGDSYWAKVDKKKRLHVASDSSSDLDSAILEGRYFGVNTGFITLTSGDPSAILYMISNSDTPFFLKTFRLSAGPSVGGTSPTKIELPLNPTGGTIVSSGTEANVFNLKVGAQESFDGTALVGEEGKTATGGAGNVFLIPHNVDDGFIYDKDSEAVISKGTSFAVIITPPVGNTSMEVQLLVTGYYIDEAKV